MNLKNNKFVIALSGGIDSVVLLHYIYNNYSYSSIRALHVNHHLSPNADIWQIFCEEYCHTMRVSLTTLHIEVDSHSNIEGLAREKRYQALYDEISNDEILLTAHHLNDQTETVLLQLCRGSSALGLSAMKEQTDRLYRPFLYKTKAWINQYAQTHSLRYIQDESNNNTHFRRNFMRHKVLPLLQSKYPSIQQSLTKVALHQQTQRVLLSDLAKIDITTLDLLDNNCLRISSLLKLTKERVLNIIYFHLQTQNIPLPNSKIAEEIYKVLSSKPDAKALVQWARYSVRIHKGLLHIEKEGDDPEFCPIYEELKDIAEFNIAYRTLGQKIKFAHKTHSESLNELLRTRGIPHWKRDSIRLYYINTKLIAIEGIGYLNTTNKF